MNLSPPRIICLSVHAALWIALCALLAWQTRELIGEAQAEYAIRNATTLEELSVPCREGSFASELAKKRGDYWHFIANPAQPERALAEYQRAAATDPNDSSHWLDLAEAYRAMGKLTQAGEAFAAADALDPNNHQVQSAYGNYLLYQGAADQAMVHHAHAIHLDRSLARNIYPLYWSLGVSPLQVADGLLDNSPDLTHQYWRDALTATTPEDAERLWQRFLKTPGLLDEGCHQAYFDFLVGHLDQAGARRIWGQITQTYYGESWDEKKEAFWNGDLRRPLKFPGGLEWRISDTLPKGSEATIGSAGGNATSQSLRLVFAGTANVAFSHIQHGLLLEPGRSYRLSFHVQAKGITTHNGPYLRLSVPGSQPVNQSAPVVTGTGAWDQTLEFKAPGGACLGEIRICRDFSNKFDNKIRGEASFGQFRLQTMN